MSATGPSEPAGVKLIWVVLIFCGILVLAAIVWLLVAPIETVTENYGPNGALVYRQTHAEYAVLAVPAIALGISAAGFIACVFSLRGALRGSRVAVRPGA